MLIDYRLDCVVVVVVGYIVGVRRNTASDTSDTSESNYILGRVSAPPQTPNLVTLLCNPTLAPSLYSSTLFSWIWHIHRDKGSW